MNTHNNKTEQIDSNLMIDRGDFNVYSSAKKEKKKL